MPKVAITFPKLHNTGAAPSFDHIPSSHSITSKSERIHCRFGFPSCLTQRARRLFVATLEGCVHSLFLFPSFLHPACHAFIDDAHAHFGSDDSYCARPDRSRPLITARLTRKKLENFVAIPTVLNVGPYTGKGESPCALDTSWQPSKSASYRKLRNHRTCTSLDPTQQ